MELDIVTDEGGAEIQLYAGIAISIEVQSIVLSTSPVEFSQHSYMAQVGGRGAVEGPRTSLSLLVGKCTVASP